MTWIDILIVIIMLALILHGIIRGLIKSIFDILGIVIGYLLALNFSGCLGIPRFIAFFLVFFISLVIVVIIGRTISKLIHITPLGIFDRILGGILGAVKGFIICFIFLIIIILLQKFDKTLYSSSIAPLILRGGLTASQTLPKSWYKRIEKIVTGKRILVRDHYDDYIYF